MVRNALFILTSDIVNRASTFVLYALIARRLGPSAMGQMAVGLTLFYAFQVLAAAGVRTVITREVARDRRSPERHLASGTLLVTVGALLSIAALAGFVHLIGYSDGTRSTILLLGLGLLPFALSVVCEAVFQALERTHYIAYAQVPVNMAKIGLAALLLSKGYGVDALALLVLACHGAIASVEWWLMLRHVARPRVEFSGSLGERLVLAMRSSRRIARSAVTFLAIDGLIAIGASLNVVLLSALADERAVGFYSAAGQLMVPVTLVYQSAVLGIFPAVCRRFDSDTEHVMRLLGKTIALLLCLAVPAAAGLFLLADSALLLFYASPDFHSSATPLRIMAWTLIPAALTAVLGQALFAGVRERVTLRIVAIDALVGLLVGVVLISRFGVVGAAVAAVITRVVDLIQHSKAVSSLVPGTSLTFLTTNGTRHFRAVMWSHVWPGQRP